MEELLVLCDTLDVVSLALAQAMAADDIATLTLLAQARGGLVERCTTLLDSLDAEQKVAIDQRLQLILAHDDVMIAEGQRRMNLLRTHVLQLQHGSRTLSGYQAPYQTLH